ncbi:MAG TPA: Smr/MutS family protein [Thermoanaerobaculia bacterium]
MDEGPVEIPITDALDLHPFRPDEIRDVALEYLTEARSRGFRQVRLIHGRGIGTQRANVQALLRRLDWIEDFWDDNSLGATVVVLKNVDTSRRA